MKKEKIIKKVFDVIVKIKVKAKDEIDALESIERELSFPSDFWDLIEDIEYNPRGVIKK